MITRQRSDFGIPILIEMGLYLPNIWGKTSISTLNSLIWQISSGNCVPESGNTEMTPDLKDRDELPPSHLLGSWTQDVFKHECFPVIWYLRISVPRQKCIHLEVKKHVENSRKHLRKIQLERMIKKIQSLLEKYNKKLLLNDILWTELHCKGRGKFPVKDLFRSGFHFKYQKLQNGAAALRALRKHPSLWWMVLCTWCYFPNVCAVSLLESHV